MTLARVAVARVAVARVAVARVAAVAGADARIRLRRTSTVVLFLLLSALAYVWVPDPSTGRALMAINNRRALYDSAAIGMATALLGTLFVGLAGFYAVSNAVRRDAQSRCGSIIAATPMRSGEYVAGKFLGNVLFLATFFGGYMLVSMAMVLVRGEAPLRPLVVLGQYLLIAPPPIVFVAALAIFFECVPWLSGRFGDVAYYFLFVLSFGLAIALTVEGGHAWAAYVDPTGMAAVLVQNIVVLGTKSISIGATSYDLHKPPLLYPGLSAGHGFLAQRLVSMLVPLPLLVIARLSFHRFDPVRVRVRAKAGHRWLSRINALLKIKSGVRWPRDLSLIDARLTVAAYPLIVPAAIAAAFTPPYIAYAIAAIAVADIASRDFSAGTLPLLYAAPHVRERFVLWKTLSTAVVAVAFLIVPLVRLHSPAAVAGAFLVVAAAAALGVIARNAKAFIVVFLSFWYIVVNDRGATPALDFAGFYGKATPGVTAAYAAIAIALLIAAHAIYTIRLQRA